MFGIKNGLAGFNVELPTVPGAADDFAFLYPPIFTDGAGSRSAGDGATAEFRHLREGSG